MVTCAYCGKDELLPFICPHCRGRFCVEHRIPESHRCSGLTTARAIPLERRESGLPRPTYERTYWLHTSPTELAHLGGAVAVAFLVEGLRILYLFGLGRALPILSTIMLSALSAFLLHELAHKLVAQHYGMWAEFRLDPLGTVMSLLTAVPFAPFKVLAPGRMVVIGYRVTPSRIGVVAVGGVLVNLGLAVAFAATMPWNPLLFYGAVLNADLALFNLLPFGFLDGRRAFDWDKKVWLIAFGATVVLWLYLWIG